MRVLTAQQMRDADRRAVAAGVPSLTLMENAGRQVVAAMRAAFPNLSSSRVAIIAGRGNNGGDGFVVARLLHEQGIAARTVLIGRAVDVTPDAATNLRRLQQLGLPVDEAPDEAAWIRARPAALECDVVVDALVGTGLTSPLSGLFATVVRDINAAARRVVAIDLPSGLIADRADVPGEAIEATLTVTLGAPKLAVAQSPAESRAGALVVVDIGIPVEVIATIEGLWIELTTRESVRRRLPPRRADAHKGDFGRLLIIAGSAGKTGAASLAAMGALRSGAGLVTVATPAGSASIVAALGREYMTLALPDDGGMIAKSALPAVLAFGADVVAAGPGLGRSSGVASFVRGLIEQCRKPLVLDADALHPLAADATPLQRRRGLATVLTPHPGEMAALIGRPVADVQANRMAIARDYAIAHGVVVVLKGSRTVIAAPDGRAFINPTGNPGMATAGTGDVLTGAVAAWVAQLPALEDACTVAVYLHGAAGDLAARDEGEIGLVAGDLLDRLGRAARDLQERPGAAAQS